MKIDRRSFVTGGVLASMGRPRAQAVAKAPRYTRCYGLDSAETVFAYSRVSPAGRLLVYTSQPRNSSSAARRVNVIDRVRGTALFSDAGFDAYFSPDGQRLIYRGIRRNKHTVVIHDMDTDTDVEDVAPISLGDYYSWGRRNGRDIILTILARYLYLDESSKAIMPATEVPRCDGIGRGERPLLSKDGRSVTVFVNGTVVVRPLDGCGGIVYTGLRGAKADFSYDGRYIALHVPTASGSRYNVCVVDLVDGTIRNVTGTCQVD